MKDYRKYSYWLETSGDDLTPRPPLDGSIDVDVAILGAGYSGLWTAYYLLRQNPGLRVVLVEKEIAGFGASGRNGGWCYAGFPLTLEGMEQRYGAAGARDVQLAMYATIREISRITEEESIDCDFEKSGYLRLARGRHQLPIVQDGFRTLQRLGLADHYRLLSASEALERVHVTDVHGALYGFEGASIHPGKLVRGLARVVERYGATIYEGTEVTDYRTGPHPALLTPRAEVRAATIVLAGEAYLSRLKKLHRQVIPVYSLITLTEPLSPEQWEMIGWQHRELISSHKLTVDYLNRTADGRILFGSRGAPYHYRSRIEDSYDRYAPTHEMIKRLILEWFPSLHEVRFTHSWGGPVGMPRDFHPTFRYDRKEGVATARAYTGTGVATTNLAGRILADLIRGEQTSLTALPIVGHRSRDWEPEPLRWLGVRYMQMVFGRIDARAERTGHPPTGKTIAERMTEH
jgi:glycine/D-amino acid oxidase-like deaminating enzyme